MSTSESNGSLKTPLCQESKANESHIQNPHQVVYDEDTQEMDSSDIDRPVANPEMPQEMAEDLEDADTIKDTVFSKHWAISVLLEFVRVGGWK